MSDTVQDRIARYRMFVNSNKIAVLAIATAAQDREVLDYMLSEIGIVPRRDELVHTPVEDVPRDDFADLRSVNVLVLIDWSGSMSSGYTSFTSPLVPLAIPTLTHKQQSMSSVALQTANYLASNIEPETRIAVVVTNSDVTRPVYCGIASELGPLRHVGWTAKHPPTNGVGEGNREALAHVLNLCNPVRVIVITDGHEQCYAQQHAEYLAVRAPRLEWYFTGDPENTCLDLCTRPGFVGRIVA